MNICVCVCVIASVCNHWSRLLGSPRPSSSAAGGQRDFDEAASIRPPLPIMPFSMANSEWMTQQALDGHFHVAALQQRKENKKKLPSVCVCVCVWGSVEESKPSPPIKVQLFLLSVMNTECVLCVPLWSCRVSCTGVLVSVPPKFMPFSRSFTLAAQRGRCSFFLSKFFTFSMHHYWSAFA